MRELLEKTLAVSKDMNEFDVRRALKTAAVAGVVGATAVGLGLRKGVSQKKIEKPPTATRVEQSRQIDMERIAQIESGGDPKAENRRTGARGLCQIMKPTWEECTKLMGKDWSWEEAFDSEKNRTVADFYMNVRIPQMLKFYKIENTIENRLAAYNWGVGNLARKGLENAPQETIDYIEKYNE